MDILSQRRSLMAAPVEPGEELAGVFTARGMFFV